MTCRPGTSVLVLVDREQTLPAHAAARRRGRLPTSPVELTYARASPSFGQFNRPSGRVADRPSELSRNSGRHRSRPANAGSWVVDRQIKLRGNRVYLKDRRLAERRTPVPVFAISARGRNHSRRDDAALKTQAARRRTASRLRVAPMSMSRMTRFFAGHEGYLGHARSVRAGPKGPFYSLRPQNQIPPAAPTAPTSGRYGTSANNYGFRAALAMKSYRLLLLDAKGRLLGSRAVDCLTDAEAIALAERESRTFALIEIWRGGDLVGTFTNPRAGKHGD